MTCDVVTFRRLHKMQRPDDRSSHQTSTQAWRYHCFLPGLQGSFFVVRSRNKTNTHLNAGSHLIAVNEFPR